MPRVVDVYAPYVVAFRAYERLVNLELGSDVGGIDYEVLALIFIWRVKRDYQRICTGLDVQLAFKHFCQLADRYNLVVGKVGLVGFSHP